MPYHIDEENSELVFGVHDGDKLVISLKPGAGSGSVSYTHLTLPTTPYV